MPCLWATQQLLKAEEALIVNRPYIPSWSGIQTGLLKNYRNICLLLGGASKMDFCLYKISQLWRIWTLRLNPGYSRGNIEAVYLHEDVVVWDNYADDGFAAHAMLRGRLALVSVYLCFVCLLTPMPQSAARLCAQDIIRKVQVLIHKAPALVGVYFPVLYYEKYINQCVLYSGCSRFWTWCNILVKLSLDFKRKDVFWFNKHEQQPKKKFNSETTLSLSLVVLLSWDHFKSLVLKVLYVTIYISIVFLIVYCCQCVNRL